MHEAVWEKEVFLPAKKLGERPGARRLAGGPQSLPDTFFFSQQPRRRKVSP